MDAVAAFVDPGPEWDRAAARLAALGLTDVYYDPRYMALYLKDGARMSAFVFEAAGELFFLPVIETPVAGHDGAFDFETAYGYGGPLASTDDPGFLGRAWEGFAAHARARGLIAGQIRSHPLLGTERFMAGSPLEVLSSRKTVSVDCGRSPEAIVAGYDKKHRWWLRRLADQGVTVEVSEAPDALHRFAAFYADRMAELGADAEYRFEDRYFDGIGELGPGRWRVYLARSPSGDLMGGCLILLGGRFAHYHLAAARQDQFGLGPNDVALARAIEDLAGGGGCERLHLGGARTGAPDDSLMRFKAKFASDQHDYRLTGCVLDPAAHDGICARWAADFPEKVAAYGDRLLRYRY